MGNAVEKKYKDFIEHIINNIIPLMPEDVNKLQQDYLINHLRHSCLLLADSMQNDSVFKTLSYENQQLYLQIMAEWSFHKEIDLFRSGIPAKYWKTVMQKIWFTIWEVMFACIQNDAPGQVVMTVIERYVNRTYNAAIEELKDTNIIDEEIEDKAKKQSNIETMAIEYREKIKKRKVKRKIFYAFLFVVIAIIVSASVLFFKIYGIIGVLTAVVIYNVLPRMD